MLYFVGIGPGDPELLTLKAVRILQEADAIAIPDSGKDSVVWRIAGKWMEGKPVCRLPMPMKGERADWEHAHRRAAQRLLEWLDEYETIVYPVLGDPGIYASGSYLLKKIAPQHPCKVIPGVPAMCAAAAELGISLCEQGENLLVMDSPDWERLEDAENAVIMKAGHSLDNIRENAVNHDAYFVQNLGMKNQIIGKVNADTQLSYSYFTLMCLKRK